MHKRKLDAVKEVYFQGVYELQAVDCSKMETSVFLELSKLADIKVKRLQNKNNR